MSGHRRRNARNEGGDSGKAAKQNSYTVFSFPVMLKQSVDTEQQNGPNRYPGKEYMMKIVHIAFSGIMIALLLSACGEEMTGSRVMTTKVDSYTPDLPPIPQIPTPSVPETYGDGSYSVFGLRKNVAKTVNTNVSVTAYVANLYQRPECPEGRTCHVMMPHLYLADEKGETLQKRLLRLVGFAQSFKEMEDAREDAEAGREPEELPEGVYLPPVIWDWREGHKYRIKGSFAHRSGTGFMDADGLLEYKEHECLDCPPEEEETAKQKKR
jgi:hypothetical protein